MAVLVLQVEEEGEEGEGLRKHLKCLQHTVGSLIVGPEVNKEKKKDLVSELHKEDLKLFRVHLRSYFRLTKSRTETCAARGSEICGMAGGKYPAGHSKYGGCTGEDALKKIHKTKVMLQHNTYKD